MSRKVLTILHNTESIQICQKPLHAGQTYHRNTSKTSSNRDESKKLLQTMPKLA